MNRTLIKDTVSQIGNEVTLFGWVNSVRSHGKIIFLDLRDITGIIQMVDTRKIEQKIGNEYVVKVKGLIKKRPENLVNAKIPTGTIEMEIKELEILNSSKEMPFPIDTD